MRVTTKALRSVMPKQSALVSMTRKILICVSSSELLGGADGLTTVQRRLLIKAVVRLGSQKVSGLLCRRRKEINPKHHPVRLQPIQRRVEQDHEQPSESAVVTTTNGHNKMLSPKRRQNGVAAVAAPSVSQQQPDTHGHPAAGEAARNGVMTGIGVETTRTPMAGGIRDSFAKSIIEITDRSLHCAFCQ